MLDRLGVSEAMHGHISYIMKAYMGGVGEGLCEQGRLKKICSFRESFLQTGFEGPDKTKSFVQEAIHQSGTKDAQLLALAAKIPEEEAPESFEPEPDPADRYCYVTVITEYTVIALHTVGSATLHVYSN